MTDKVLRFPTGLASMENLHNEDHAKWLHSLADDAGRDDLDAIIVLTLDKGGSMHTFLSRTMRHDQLIGVLALAQFASVERMRGND